MPKLLILLTVVMVTFIAILADRQHFVTPEIATVTQDTATVVPDFLLTGFDGNTNARLHDFAGKPIILNFWASWCTPCITEFPALLELAHKHKGKAVLITISVDETPENATIFLANLQAKHPEWMANPSLHHAWDGTKSITQDIFHTFRYPETLLVAPDLTMQQKFAGALTEGQLAEVETFLSSKQPTVQ